MLDLPASSSQSRLAHTASATTTAAISVTTGLAAQRPDAPHPAPIASHRLSATSATVLPQPLALRSCMAAASSTADCGAPITTPGFRPVGSHGQTEKDWAAARHWLAGDETEQAEALRRLDQKRATERSLTLAVPRKSGAAARGAITLDDDSKEWSPGLGRNAASAGKPAPDRASGSDSDHGSDSKSDRSSNASRGAGSDPSTGLGKGIQAGTNPGAERISEHAEALRTIPDQAGLAEYLLRTPKALPAILHAIAQEPPALAISTEDALMVVAECTDIDDRTLTEVIQSNARPADQQRLLVLTTLQTIHEGEPLRVLYAIEDALRQPGATFNALVRQMAQSDPGCDDTIEGATLAPLVNACSKNLLEDGQLDDEAELAVRLVRDLVNFSVERRDTLITNDLFEDQAGVLALMNLFSDGTIFAAAYGAALGALAAAAVRHPEALPIAYPAQDPLALLRALRELGPGCETGSLERMIHFTLAAIRRANSTPGAMDDHARLACNELLFEMLRHDPEAGPRFSVTERGHLLAAVLSQKPQPERAAMLAMVTQGMTASEAARLKAAVEQSLPCDLETFIGPAPRAGLPLRDARDFSEEF